MEAVVRAFPPARPAQTLASLALAAGAGGMAVSFLFLASADRLDVLAGAAGFVAGAVLVAAGVISAAVLSRPAAGRLPAAAPALDVGRWLAHFRNNREARPEPDWAAP